MSSSIVRVPVRPRPAAQRNNKVDENAASRHVRHTSADDRQAEKVGRTSFTNAVVNGIRAGLSRPVLNEVTTAANNRKVQEANRLSGSKLKDAAEPTHKRTRSATFFKPPSNVAQRVAPAPARQPIRPPAPAVTAPAPAPSRTYNSVVSRLQAARRISRVPPPDPVPVEVVVQVEELLPSLDSDGMQIEESGHRDSYVEDESSLLRGEKEVEAIVRVEAHEEEEETAKVTPAPKPPRVWPDVDTECAAKYRKKIDEVRETFEEEADEEDLAMVSEYAEEIFEYMSELEESVMPSATYMDGQTEITWGMRQTLVDWLLQVHLRYHMLPETLWITINIVDRFLSRRVVSLVKLQLVGVTAMFIAAKFEEILAPSVDEFVFMTENGYTREEILKGERIMLQTLDFKISHYCSPYSWMRRISRADDYDIQTRTLSKFLTEVTLLDWRFLRVKPSLVAAIGMYTARTMLGGDWNNAFMFYSGYTEEQLQPGYQLLLEKLVERGFCKQHVCIKYASKKFLKASVFAIEWAKMHVESELDPAALEELMSEE